MRHYGKARAQDIYIFPAAHSHTKSAIAGLRIDELLGTQNGEDTVKDSGFFLYT